MLMLVLELVLMLVLVLLRVLVLDIVLMLVLVLVLVLGVPMLILMLMHMSHEDSIMRAFVLLMCCQFRYFFDALCLSMYVAHSQTAQVYNTVSSSITMSILVSQSTKSSLLALLITTSRLPTVFSQSACSTLTSCLLESFCTLRNLSSLFSH